LGIGCLSQRVRAVTFAGKPTDSKYLIEYPVDGDNVVGKIKYESDNVFINEVQYFANVPSVA